MTLTLDFQGQILKKSYLRNGMADWHGIKEVWVDRILDPCCDFQFTPHPWPWPWIFKVKFWKCCISGMGGSIDMERKGCETIGSYTHFVTFFTSTMALTLDLRNGMADWHGMKGMWLTLTQGQILAVSQGRLTWTKGMWVDRMLEPTLWLCSTMTLTLDFQGKFWKSRIAGMGWPIEMERKGCESIEC